MLPIVAHTGFLTMKSRQVMQMFKNKKKIVSSGILNINSDKPHLRMFRM